jgi:hypothetical protein
VASERCLCRCVSRPGPHGADAAATCDMRHADVRAALHQQLRNQHMQELDEPASNASDSVHDKWGYLLASESVIASATTWKALKTGGQVFQ